MSKEKGSFREALKPFVPLAVVVGVLGIIAALTSGDVLSASAEFTGL